ncbi:MAG: hypothetical protein ACKO1O_08815 [Erythrobacter sp.]
MFKSVGVVIVLGLLAYAAAVGTYFLLPDQPTDASFIDGAMKISGPIAAFIIVFLILSQVFNRVFGDVSKQTSALDPDAEALVGNWDVVSRSYGASEESRNSLAKIKIDKQRLVMQGGGLKQVKDGASKETGHWNCEAMFFEDGRIVYIYDMEDRSFPSDPKTSGVVVAQLEPGVSPLKLVGTWSTFRGNSHSGVITLTKRS